MDAFFGELYLRTTRPFLHDRVTRLEASFIATALHLEPHERVLDICSGHGRHVDLLRRMGHRAWGVERDARSLAESSILGRAVTVRGDMYHLPFRDRFEAAYCWYASLFLSADDAVNRAALREAASALVPGGRMLIHTHHPEGQARQAKGHFEADLADGSHLVEDTAFDTTAGVLRGHRTLRSSGRLLEGDFQVRCPSLEEERSWCEAEGLVLENAWGDVEASSPSGDRPDLIALIRRPKAQ